MGKYLGELTDNEFRKAIGNVDDFVGMWMNKNNIQSGSHLSSPFNKSNPYDIYNAIKKALRQEFQKAKPSK